MKRSDATLKPGGVRIGTAEIYRIVEDLPEINDSIVIGQPWRGDIRVVLYVKLEHACELTPALSQRSAPLLKHRHPLDTSSASSSKSIKFHILGAGKKVELAVRDIAMDELNREALQDPAAFDGYEL